MKLGIYMVGLLLAGNAPVLKGAESSAVSQQRVICACFKDECPECASSKNQQFTLPLIIGGQMPRHNSRTVSHRRRARIVGREINGVTMPDWMREAARKAAHVEFGSSTQPSLNMGNMSHSFTGTIAVLYPQRAQDEKNGVLTKEVIAQ